MFKATVSSSELQELIQLAQKIQGDLQALAEKLKVLSQSLAEAEMTPSATTAKPGLEEKEAEPAPGIEKEEKAQPSVPPEDIEEMEKRWREGLSKVGAQ